MELCTTSQVTKAATRDLLSKLQENESSLFYQDAVIYTDFPVFTDPDTQVAYPDITVVSPKLGIVMFFVDERTARTLTPLEIEKKLREIDQVYTSLYSSCIRIPALRKSRLNLFFSIRACVFFPHFGEEIEKGNFDYIEQIHTNAEISEFLTVGTDEEISPEVFTELIATLEGTRAIRRVTERPVDIDDQSSMGAILDSLDTEIDLFDRQQKLAALSQINGPQRIRGLAGSGKTVILAMKAALLHIRNPKARILYTFWTKSLYDYIRSLITRFYRVYQPDDPNWDMLHVRHAWGGINLPGVYYDACLANGVVPIQFKEAKSKSKRNSPFAYICNELLAIRSGELKKTYDYVLLDEGQDFDAPFYWICRQIVRDDCIAWAYDELQNVINVEIQDPVKLFENEYGHKGIDLVELSKHDQYGNNDIVLHTCYRNPREVLVVAHAIGFGIYNDEILQMLENKAHWEDLGYKVIKGNCETGQSTIVTRPKDNSPSLISEHYKIDDIIIVKEFSGMSSEIEWVSNQILVNTKDNLLPEDIMVICLDDRNARKYLERIEKSLSKKGIGVNNIIESYSGDHFIVKGAVTLSTVYRAKGNETAMVYVIGADSFDFFSKDDIRARNKIFTALTRAKAWVRITGSGSTMTWLKDEISTAIANFPEMKFTYPDIDRIKILRRDFSEAAQRKGRELEHLASEMAALGLSLDDLTAHINRTQKSPNSDK